MQARINRNIFIALAISIQLLSQPLLAGPGGFGELTWLPNLVLQAQTSDPSDPGGGQGSCGSTISVYGQHGLHVIGPASDESRATRGSEHHL